MNNDDLLFTNVPQKKKSPSTVIAVIAVIIAIAAVVMAGIVIWGGLPSNPASAPSNPSTSQGVGLTVDPNAGAYVAPPPTQGVAIPGFDSLTIPAYTTNVVGIDLHNPIENEGWYYLTFKLSLLDSSGAVSETLYESQLVPPGQYVQDITLSRGLDPGVYDAVLFVQPYRVADITPTNNANLELTLTVV